MSLIAQTLSFTVTFDDETANVAQGGSAAERAMALKAGGEITLQPQYVRTLCTLGGSYVVSATDCLRMREEGAIERSEPEGDGQRVWFEVVASGQSRAEAISEAAVLMAEMGHGEAADWVKVSSPELAQPTTPG